MSDFAGLGQRCQGAGVGQVDRLFQTGVLQMESVWVCRANCQAARPSQRRSDRGVPRRDLKMAIMLGCRVA